jgi:hypothetical protein
MDILIRCPFFSRLHPNERILLHGGAVSPDSTGKIDPVAAGVIEVNIHM